MRILAVCSHAGRGGCERSFAILLKHLPGSAERGAVTIGDGPLVDLLERNGVPSTALPEFAARPSAQDLWRFTRLMVPRLRRSRPDVVWAAGQKAALLSGPACRLAGVPLVWHKVDFSWDRLLARPLALSARGVTAVSRAVTRPLGRLGSMRLLGVVPPPIEPGFGAGRQVHAAEPTLGSLGRLVPYKGHHRIIEAAAALRHEFPPVRVLIAGGPVPEYPDYPARLSALADELGMRDRVHFLGFVDDPAAVLAGVGVFVSATYRDGEGYGLEGRGRAIIEASWMGLPVVVARAGGAEESVLDGRTGTLVPEAEPGALAGAIAPYLRSPELAARTGTSGKSFARSTFAADAAAARLLDLLRPFARA